jgi:hypothetical protein
LPSSSTINFEAIAVQTSAAPALAVSQTIPGCRPAGVLGRALGRRPGNAGDAAGDRERPRQLAPADVLAQYPRAEREQQQQPQRQRRLDDRERDERQREQLQRPAGGVQQHARDPERAPHEVPEHGRPQRVPHRHPARFERQQRIGAVVATSGEQGDEDAGDQLRPSASRQRACRLAQPVRARPGASGKRLTTTPPPTLPRGGTR